MQTGRQGNPAGHKQPSEPQRARRVTRRAGAERRTAQPLTRLAREGYLGFFRWVVAATCAASWGIRRLRFVASNNHDLDAWAASVEQLLQPPEFSSRCVEKALGIVQPGCFRYRRPVLVFELGKEIGLNVAEPIPG